MNAPLLEQVAGYPLALDRYFAPTTHVWVQVLTPSRVRLGIDAVGAETNGTLAQLVLLPVGTRVEVGQSVGTVEAAKFVGPLASPIRGVVCANNAAVVADAGTVERDPYGAGWLVEVEPDDLETDLAELLTGDDARAWFAQRVAQYRAEGVLAQ